jgi:thiamine-phosphate pyrophosphorylase
VRLPPLYPIVNVATSDGSAGDRAVALAVELATAGATLLQLRAKTLGAGAYSELASRMLEALRGSPARLIVNDRLDVALACGADGVHLGDEDLPVAAARRIVLDAAAGSGSARVPSPFVIGFSTHSPDEAALADAAPADYLGFGPVFESPTKAGVREARGLELLRRACTATRLPVVAIGGVTLATAIDCWKAGAASVAVIREIETAADRRALVADYLHAARDAGVCIDPD